VGISGETSPPRTWPPRLVPPTLPPGLSNVQLGRGRRTCRAADGWRLGHTVGPPRNLWGCIYITCGSARDGLYLSLLLPDKHTHRRLHDVGIAPIPTPPLSEIHAADANRCISARDSVDDDTARSEHLHNAFTHTQPDPRDRTESAPVHLRTETPSGCLAVRCRVHALRTREDIHNTRFIASHSATSQCPCAPSPRTEFRSSVPRGSRPRRPAAAGLRSPFQAAA